MNKIQAFDYIVKNYGTGFFKSTTHKYFKREGTPGHYKYFYTQEEYEQHKLLNMNQKKGDSEDNVKNIREIDNNFTYIKNWDVDMLKRVSEKFFRKKINNIDEFDEKLALNALNELKNRGVNVNEDDIIGVNIIDKKYKDYSSVNENYFKLRNNIKSNYDKEQKETLNSYKVTGYKEINRQLRDGEIDDDVKRQIKIIDSAFLVADTLKEDIVVYRNSLDLNDKAYKSTSLSKDIAKNHLKNGKVFEIKVPKGTKVIWMDDFGLEGDKEKEILLHRDFKIE